MRRFIPILFPLMFWIHYVQGQDTVSYYVDGSVAVSGNGTETSPWQTITEAVAAPAAPEGEIIAINVAPGTYSEPTINITRPLIIARFQPNPENGEPAPEGGNRDTVLVQAPAGPLFRVALEVGQATIQNIVLQNEPALVPEDVQPAIVVDSAARLSIVGNTFRGFATAIQVIDSASSVDIRMNTFQDFSNGIDIQPGAVVSELSIRENSFATDGEEPLAVSNATTDTIRAEYNWWGRTENIPVTVSAVDYSPYLASGVDNDPDSIGFQGNFSSVVLDSESPSYDTTLNELQAAYNEERSDTLTVTGNNPAYDTLRANRAATLVVAQDTLVVANLLVGISNDTSINVGGSLLIDRSIAVDSGRVQTLDSGQVILGDSITQTSTVLDTALVGNFTTTPRDIGPDEALDILGVTIGSSDSLNNLSVNRIDGEGSAVVSGGESIDSRWIIDADESVSSEQTLVFRWSSTNDNGNFFSASNPDPATVWRSNGNEWEPVDEDVPATIGGIRTVSVLNTNVSDAATWTITGINQALPVILTDFTARTEEISVHLRWTTASETNSDYFSVERSTDGFTYQPLARSRAAGESQQERTYRYTDEGVAHRLSGTVYYRLRMVDFDGSFEYSPAVAASLDGDTPFLVYAHHQGAFSIFASLPEPNYRVQVSDLTGRVVYETLLTTESNVREYVLPVPPLSPSVYVLRCVGLQDIQIRKFRVE